MERFSMVYLYQSELKRVYTENNAGIFSACKQIIQVHCREFADQFFEQLMTDPGARTFLEPDKVEQRLKRVLQEWLIDSFTIKQGEAINTYIERQVKIGEVHARIKIPMTLVDHGMRILKQSVTEKVFQYYQNSDIDRAVIVTNEILDISVALMNEVYLNHLVENERNAQVLKMNFTSHRLAIECEKIRASLLHWLSEVLILFFSDDIESVLFPDLRKSDFALWITHKADFYFNASPDVKKLKTKIDEIEKDLEFAMASPKTSSCDDRSAAVATLNRHVGEADWLLENLSKEIMALESSKDPLTNLLTRRYLPSILQHEIRHAQRTGKPFAILLLDVDYFKRLNDQFGHDVGDIVLARVAQILTLSVRAGDYVIRYGGEELLIILADTTSTSATAIAEKLRNKVAAHTFAHPKISDENEVKITISIGIALYDGHPDYARMIDSADCALLRAKELGRNQVVLAE